MQAGTIVGRLVQARTIHMRNASNRQSEVCLHNVATTSNDNEVVTCETRLARCCASGARLPPRSLPHEHNASDRLQLSQLKLRSTCYLIAAFASRLRRSPLHHAACHTEHNASDRPRLSQLELRAPVTSLLHSPRASGARLSTIEPVTQTPRIRQASVVYARPQDAPVNH